MEVGSPRVLSTHKSHKQNIWIQNSTNFFRIHAFETCRGMAALPAEAALEASMRELALGPRVLGPAVDANFREARIDAGPPFAPVGMAALPAEADLEANMRDVVLGPPAPGPAVDTLFREAWNDSDAASPTPLVSR